MLDKDWRRHYGDGSHPPACTCVQCNEGDGRHPPDCACDDCYEGSSGHSHGCACDDCTENGSEHPPSCACNDCQARRVAEIREWYTQRGTSRRTGGNPRSSAPVAGDSNRITNRQSTATPTPRNGARNKGGGGAKVLLWGLLSVVAIIAIAAFAGVTTDDIRSLLAPPQPMLAPVVVVATAAPVDTPTSTSTPVPTPTPNTVLARQSAASIAPTVFTPAPTPAFTSAHIVTSAATVVPTAPLIPTSTPTVVPTAPLIPTSTPTATPKPLNLVLDTETTIDGYWSDGTANINLSLLLRNEGSLPFQENQPITVSCTHDDNLVEGCSANTETSLPDGFGPAQTNLTLRAPMGLLQFDIDYGGDAPHIMSVNVPERILGVDRDIWECYSDRETPNRCYGWYSETVDKWRSDAPVKAWATGNANYIRAFREILDEELSPLLNLEFQWVDEELDADFVATLGISLSEKGKGGWRNCAHYWGCGGPNNFGEVRSGDLVVFHLERHDEILNDYEALKKELEGVIIHESLHALAPVGHGHKVLSIMAGGGYLSFVDKAMLRLNSHPLVKPGMTMTMVESLIVFRDELLDSPQMELDSYETLERAFAALQDAGTARMKVRGGWSGGGCEDERFGHPNWATLELGHFWQWPNDPLLAHLKDGANAFFIFHSNEAANAGENGWQHWGKSARGWKQISRRQLSNDTAWWIKNSKPHWTLSVVLYNQSADDIRIAEKSDGKISMEIEFNPTEFVSSWRLADETLEMMLVIDEETYKIESYTWTWHYGNRNYCSTYSEEVKDFEYGIEIEIPDAIITGSKYALPK